MAGNWILAFGRSQPKRNTVNIEKPSRESGTGGLDAVGLGQAAAFQFGSNAACGGHGATAWIGSPPSSLA